jgi:hypothetical protein
MSDEEWTWELAATAQTDLDSFSPAEQDRILDKLDEIVSSPGETHRTTVNRYRTVRTRRFESGSSDSP